MCLLKFLELFTLHFSSSEAHQSLALSRVGGRHFTIVSLGGIANLSELIFQRQNCAVGMKRRIYNNYHKNF